MKIGVLGLIMSDLSDVDYNKIRWAAELGFHGVGAHLTVPADSITDERATTVKSVFADQNIPFLQVWGPYPCIISPDESIRRAGVTGAAALVKLASKMGVPASGVRPTRNSASGRRLWHRHRSRNPCHDDSPFGTGDQAGDRAYGIKTTQGQPRSL